MVFANYIASILSSYLGKYIKGLNVESVNVSLLRGSIELKNLELSPDALNFSDSILLENGTIRSLAVKIPWLSLYSTRCEVVIKGVVITVGPNYSKGKPKFFASKEDFTTAAFGFINAEPKDEKSESVSKGGFFHRLQQTILKNLIFRVENVVFRLEDSTGCWKGQSAGIESRITRLSCEATDSNYKPSFLSPQDDPAKEPLHRLISYEGLSVFLLRNASTSNAGLGPKTVPLRYGGSTDAPLVDEQLLLSPEGALRVLFYEQEIQEHSRPCINATLTIQKTSLQWNVHAVEVIGILIESVRRAPHRLLAWNERPRNRNCQRHLITASEWWRYAIRKVMAYREVKWQRRHFDWITFQQRKRFLSDIYVYFLWLLKAPWIKDKSVLSIDEQLLVHTPLQEVMGCCDAARECMAQYIITGEVPDDSAYIQYLRYHDKCEKKTQRISDLWSDPAKHVPVELTFSLKCNELVVALDENLEFMATETHIGTAMGHSELRVELGVASTILIAANDRRKPVLLINGNDAGISFTMSKLRNFSPKGKITFDNISSCLDLPLQELLIAKLASYWVTAEEFRLQDLSESKGQPLPNAANVKDSVIAEWQQLISFEVEVKSFTAQADGVSLGVREVTLSLEPWKPIIVKAHEATVLARSTILVRLCTIAVTREIHGSNVRINVMTDCTSMSTNVEEFEFVKSVLYSVTQLWCRREKTSAAIPSALNTVEHLVIEQGPTLTVVLCFEFIECGALALESFSVRATVGDGWHIHLSAAGSTTEGWCHSIPPRSMDPFVDIHVWANGFLKESPFRDNIQSKGIAFTCDLNHVTVCLGDNFIASVESLYDIAILLFYAAEDRHVYLSEREKFAPPNIIGHVTASYSKLLLESSGGHSSLASQSADVCAPMSSAAAAATGAGNGVRTPPVMPLIVELSSEECLHVSLHRYCDKRMDIRVVLRHGVSVYLTGTPAHIPLLLDREDSRAEVSFDLSAPSKADLTIFPYGRSKISMNLSHMAIVTHIPTIMALWTFFITPTLPLCRLRSLASRVHYSSRANRTGKSLAPRTPRSAEVEKIGASAFARISQNLVNGANAKKTGTSSTTYSTPVFPSDMELRVEVAHSELYYPWGEGCVAPLFMQAVVLNGEIALLLRDGCVEASVRGLLTIPRAVAVLSGSQMRRKPSNKAKSQDKVREACPSHVGEAASSRGGYEDPLKELGESATGAAPQKLESPPPKSTVMFASCEVTAPLEPPVCFPSGDEFSLAEKAIWDARADTFHNSSSCAPSVRKPVEGLSAASQVAFPAPEEAARVSGRDASDSAAESFVASSLLQLHLVYAMDSRSPLEPGNAEESLHVSLTGTALPGSSALPGPLHACLRSPVEVAAWLTFFTFFTPENTVPLSPPYGVLSSWVAPFAVDKSWDPTTVDDNVEKNKTARRDESGVQRARRLLIKLHTSPIVFHVPFASAAAVLWEGAEYVAWPGYSALRIQQLDVLLHDMLSCGSPGLTAAPATSSLQPFATLRDEGYSILCFQSGVCPDGRDSGDDSSVVPAITLETRSDGPTAAEVHRQLLLPSFRGQLDQLTTLAQLQHGDTAEAVRRVLEAQKAQKELLSTVILKESRLRGLRYAAHLDCFSPTGGLDDGEVQRQLQSFLSPPLLIRVYHGALLYVRESEQRRGERAALTLALSGVRLNDESALSFENAAALVDGSGGGSAALAVHDLSTPKPLLVEVEAVEAFVWWTTAPSLGGYSVGALSSSRVPSDRSSCHPVEERKELTQKPQSTDDDAPHSLSGLTCMPLLLSPLQVHTRVALATTREELGEVTPDTNGKLTAVTLPAPALVSPAGQTATVLEEDGRQANSSFDKARRDGGGLSFDSDKNTTASLCTMPTTATSSRSSSAADVAGATCLTRAMGASHRLSPSVVAIVEVTPVHVVLGTAAFAAVRELLLAIQERELMPANAAPFTETAVPTDGLVASGREGYSRTARSQTTRVVCSPPTQYVLVYRVVEPPVLSRNVAAVLSFSGISPLLPSRREQSGFCSTEDSNPSAQSSMLANSFFVRAEEGTVERECVYRYHCTSSSVSVDAHPTSPPLPDPKVCWLDAVARKEDEEERCARLAMEEQQKVNATAVNCSDDASRQVRQLSSLSAAEGLLAMLRDPSASVEQLDRWSGQRGKGSAGRGPPPARTPPPRQSDQLRRARQSQASVPPKAVEPPPPFQSKPRQPRLKLQLVVPDLCLRLVRYRDVGTHSTVSTEADIFWQRFVASYAVTRALKDPAKSQLYRSQMISMAHAISPLCASHLPSALRRSSSNGGANPRSPIAAAVIVPHVLQQRPSSTPAAMLEESCVDALRVQLYGVDALRCMDGHLIKVDSCICTSFHRLDKPLLTMTALAMSVPSLGATPPPKVTLAASSTREPLDATVGEGAEEAVPVSTISTTAGSTGSTSPVQSREDSDAGGAAASLLSQHLEQQPSTGGHAAPVLAPASIASTPHRDTATRVTHVLSAEPTTFSGESEVVCSLHSLTVDLSVTALRVWLSLLVDPPVDASEETDVCHESGASLHDSKDATSKARGDKEVPVEVVPSSTLRCLPGNGLRVHEVREASWSLEHDLILSRDGLVLVFSSHDTNLLTVHLNGHCITLDSSLLLRPAGQPRTVIVIQGGLTVRFIGSGCVRLPLFVWSPMLVEAAANSGVETVLLPFMAVGEGSYLECTHVRLGFAEPVGKGMPVGEAGRQADVRRRDRIALSPVGRRATPTATSPSPLSFAASSAVGWGTSAGRQGDADMEDGQTHAVVYPRPPKHQPALQRRVHLRLPHVSLFLAPQSESRQLHISAAVELGMTLCDGRILRDDLRCANLTIQSESVYDAASTTACTTVLTPLDVNVCSHNGRHHAISLGPMQVDLGRADLLLLSTHAGELQALRLHMKYLTHRKVEREFMELVEATLAWKDAAGVAGNDDPPEEDKSSNYGDEEGEEEEEKAEIERTRDDRAEASLGRAHTDTAATAASLSRTSEGPSGAVRSSSPRASVVRSLVAMSSPSSGIPRRSVGQSVGEVAMALPPSALEPHAAAAGLTAIPSAVKEDSAAVSRGEQLYSKLGSTASAMTAPQRGASQQQRRRRRLQRLQQQSRGYSCAIFTPSAEITLSDHRYPLVQVCVQDMMLRRTSASANSATSHVRCQGACVRLYGRGRWDTLLRPSAALTWSLTQTVSRHSSNQHISLVVEGVHGQCSHLMVAKLLYISRQISMLAGSLRRRIAIATAAATTAPTLNDAALSAGPKTAARMTNTARETNATLPSSDSSSEASTSEDSSRCIAHEHSLTGSLSGTSHSSGSSTDAYCEADTQGSWQMSEGQDALQRDGDNAKVHGAAVGAAVAASPVAPPAVLPVPSSSRGQPSLRGTAVTAPSWLRTADMASSPTMATHRLRNSFRHTLFAGICEWAAVEATAPEALATAVATAAVPPTATVTGSMMWRCNVLYRLAPASATDIFVSYRRARSLMLTFFTADCVTWDDNGGAWVLNGNGETALAARAIIGSASSPTPSASLLTRHQRPQESRRSLNGPTSSSFPVATASTAAAAPAVTNWFSFTSLQYGMAKSLVVRTAMPKRWATETGVLPAYTSSLPPYYGCGAAGAGGFPEHVDKAPTAMSYTLTLTCEGLEEEEEMEAGAEGPGTCRHPIVLGSGEEGAVYKGSSNIDGGRYDGDSKEGARWSLTPTKKTNGPQRRRHQASFTTSPASEEQLPGAAEGHSVGNADQEGGAATTLTQRRCSSGGPRGKTSSTVSESDATPRLHARHDDDEEMSASATSATASSHHPYTQPFVSPTSRWPGQPWTPPPPPWQQRMGPNATGRTTSRGRSHYGNGDLLVVRLQARMSLLNETGCTLQLLPSPPSVCLPATSPAAASSSSSSSAGTTAPCTSASPAVIGVPPGWQLPLDEEYMFTEVVLRVCCPSPRWMSVVQTVKGTAATHTPTGTLPLEEPRRNADDEQGCNPSNVRWYEARLVLGELDSGRFLSLNRVDHKRARNCSAAPAAAVEAVQPDAAGGSDNDDIQGDDRDERLLVLFVLLTTSAEGLVNRISLYPRLTLVNQLGLTARVAVFQQDPLAGPQTPDEARLTASWTVRSVGRRQHERERYLRSLVALGAHDALPHQHALPLHFGTYGGNLVLGLTFSQSTGDAFSTVDLEPLIAHLRDAVDHHPHLLPLTDRHGRKFCIQVSVLSRTIVLSVAVWVYNLTEYPLLMSDSVVRHRLSPGQNSTSGIIPSQGEPFLIGCRLPDFTQAFFSIGLDGGWSAAVPIDVGSSGVFTSALPQLGITRSCNYTILFPNAPEGHPMTLQITPRWVFYNNTMKRLQLHFRFPGLEKAMRQAEARCQGLRRQERSSAAAAAAPTREGVMENAGIERAPGTPPAVKAVAPQEVQRRLLQEAEDTVSTLASIAAVRLNPGDFHVSCIGPVEGNQLCVREVLQGMLPSITSISGEGRVEQRDVASFYESQLTPSMNVDGPGEAMFNLWATPRAVGGRRTAVQYGSGITVQRPAHPHPTDLEPYDVEAVEAVITGRLTVAVQSADNVLTVLLQPIQGTKILLQNRTAAHTVLARQEGSRRRHRIPPRQNRFFLWEDARREHIIRVHVLGYKARWFDVDFSAGEFQVRRHVDVVAAAHAEAVELAQRLQPYPTGVRSAVGQRGGSGAFPFYVRGYTNAEKTCVTVVVTESPVPVYAAIDSWRTSQALSVRVVMAQLTWMREMHAAATAAVVQHANPQTIEDAVSVVPVGEEETVSPEGSMEQPTVHEARCADGSVGWEKLREEKQRRSTPRRQRATAAAATSPPLLRDVTAAALFTLILEGLQLERLVTEDNETCFFAVHQLQWVNEKEENVFVYRARPRLPPSPVRSGRVLQGRTEAVSSSASQLSPSRVSRGVGGSASARRSSTRMVSPLATHGVDEGAGHRRGCTDVFKPLAASAAHLFRTLFGRRDAYWSSLQKDNDVELSYSLLKYADGVTRYTELRCALTPLVVVLTDFWLVDVIHEARRLRALLGLRSQTTQTSTRTTTAPQLLAASPLPPQVCRGAPPIPPPIRPMDDCADEEGTVLAAVTPNETESLSPPLEKGSPVSLLLRQQRQNSASVTVLDLPAEEEPFGSLRGRHPRRRDSEVAAAGPNEGPPPPSPAARKATNVVGVGNAGMRRACPTDQDESVAGDLSVASSFFSSAAASTTPPSTPSTQEGSHETPEGGGPRRCAASKVQRRHHEGTCPAPSSASTTATWSPPAPPQQASVTGFLSQAVFLQQLVEQVRSRLERQDIGVMAGSLSALPAGSGGKRWRSRGRASSPRRGGASDGGDTVRPQPQLLSHATTAVRHQGGLRPGDRRIGIDMAGAPTGTSFDAEGTAAGGRNAAILLIERLEVPRVTLYVTFLRHHPDPLRPLLGAYAWMLPSQLRQCEFHLPPWTLTRQMETPASLQARLVRWGVQSLREQWTKVTKLGTLLDALQFWQHRHCPLHGAPRKLTLSYLQRQQQWSQRRPDQGAMTLRSVTFARCRSCGGEESEDDEPPIERKPTL